MTHRTLLQRTGAALVAAAVACTPADEGVVDTTAVVPPATMTAADTMAGMAMGGELTATVDSVVTAANNAGGLTGIAPAVAIPMIQRIEDALDDSGNEALDEISDDLERLREQLGAATFDAAAVGTTLASLSDRVNAFAPTAPTALQGTLQQLGTALTSAAQNLRQ